MTTLIGPAHRGHALLLAIAAAGTGLAVYAAVARVGGVVLAPSTGALIALGALMAVAGFAGALGMARRVADRGELDGRWAIAALLAAVSFLAIASLVYVFGFLRIPVDLVSFSESPFVDDIIKLRLGAPIYSPVADNNTYPYTPGTQILTYGIAQLLGAPTSIPTLGAATIRRTATAVEYGGGR